MAALLLVWVCKHDHILLLSHPGHLTYKLRIDIAVDLGGSLAVASRGLFATGVSTDLNGKLHPKPIFEVDVQRVG